MNGERERQRKIDRQKERVKRERYFNRMPEVYNQAKLCKLLGYESFTKKDY